MEKVVTVGVVLKLEKDKKAIYESLDELAGLVLTAGGKIIETFTVQRDKIDPAYYIGKGKAEEISEYVAKNKIHTVVFDRELSAAQIRNLEEIINAKIIDRTRLILDIFAKRAHTKEAKLQVELAQLQYMLPRLTQKGIHMDNQIGGIGTRGPGETKLEYDRRKIMQRITKIKEELEKIIISRNEQTKLRRETGIPIIVLIGYTNSGKSTLFNTLLKSNQAYADDKLFATLDPLTRKLRLPSTNEVLITDTVGFINNLPHNLVESFKSTLEIVKDADIILEVIDLTYKEIEKREKLVTQILNELGVSNPTIIKVFNKIDLLPKKLQIYYVKKFSRISNCEVISAKTGFRVDQLLKKIDNLIKKNMVTKTIAINYENYKVLDLLYKYCKVISNNVYNNFSLIKFLTTKAIYNKIKNLLNNEKNFFNS